LKNGKGAEVELKKEIVVRPQKSRLVGERTWIEATTFSIALGVALIGLVAGAREQLLKLDLIAGLMGIFLIGFSADTVKNLLTQSSREKDTIAETPTVTPKPAIPAVTPKLEAPAVIPKLETLAVTPKMS
jgi:hypothetical protein